MPTVVVHGGAWAIPDELDEDSLHGCVTAARVGLQTLLQRTEVTMHASPQATGSAALDAVQAAVEALETDPVFDAGVGSCMNELGQVEMDAAIMDGATLRAGGVAAVRNIEHPIALARDIMEHTSHCFLVGAGANRFADERGFPTLSDKQLASDESVREFEAFSSYGGVVSELFNRPAPEGHAPIQPVQGHDTVGAVAVDEHANVAAATSTGGITLKMAGRVGDSPIVGAGLYADNELGAASTTGHGESIMRVLLALDALRRGSRVALAHMDRRTGGAGGVISIDAQGRVALAHTTTKMAWACATTDAEVAAMFEKLPTTEYAWQHDKSDSAAQLPAGCFVYGGLRLPITSETPLPLPPAPEQDGHPGRKPVHWCCSRLETS